MSKALAGALSSSLPSLALLQGSWPYPSNSGSANDGAGAGRRALVLAPEGLRRTRQIESQAREQ